MPSVVKKLEGTGCSNAEATALLKALETVFQESHENLLGVAVRRDDHERVHLVLMTPGRC